MKLHLRGAWVHDFSTDATMNAAFVEMAGSDFTVRGASRARDAALVSAGVDWRLSDGMTFTAGVSGEVSAQATSVTPTARLSMVW